MVGRRYYDTSKWLISTWVPVVVGIRRRTMRYDFKMKI
jgi:hypothetical protein